MFYFILIAFLAFLPIALWGYLLSYFENTPFNARRFLIGMVAGGVSVAPILGAQTFFSWFKVGQINPFNIVALPSVEPVSMIAGLEFFIVVVAAFILFCAFSFFFESTLKTVSLYMKNAFLLLLLAGGLTLVYFFFASSLFSQPYPLTVGDKVIGSVGMVLFYYLLVGFAEEGSKHLSFLASSSDDSKTLSDGILYALFVALGFGFLENILYLWNVFQNAQSFSAVFSTWFFRSLFSLFVHMVCGGLVGWYFVRSWRGFQLDKNTKKYSINIMKGIVYSLSFHALFDILLTFKFSFAVFIYILVAYLIFTKFFYSPEEDITLQEAQ